MKKSKIEKDIEFWFFLEGGESAEKNVVEKIIKPYTQNEAEAASLTEYYKLLVANQITFEDLSQKEKDAVCLVLDDFDKTGAIEDMIFEIERCYEDGLLDGFFSENENCSKEVFISKICSLCFSDIVKLYDYVDSYQKDKQRAIIVW